MGILTCPYVSNLARPTCAQHLKTEAACWSVASGGAGAEDSLVTSGLNRASVDFGRWIHALFNRIFAKFRRLRVSAVKARCKLPEAYPRRTSSEPGAENPAGNL